MEWRGGFTQSLKGILLCISSRAGLPAPQGRLEAWVSSTVRGRHALGHLLQRCCATCLQLLPMLIAGAAAVLAAADAIVNRTGAAALPMLPCWEA